MASEINVFLLLLPCFHLLYNSFIFFSFFFFVFLSLIPYSLVDLYFRFLARGIKCFSESLLKLLSPFHEISMNVLVSWDS